ncbi:hypothetical protein FAZ95_05315 [Trinickia violacea]|uniref:Uncharacterized protein n=1 Tax=Trinickia violacea TaxID=2571746 RepID=A0A4P8IRX2_9BURK|nr:hypothetical protein [Trinickia violacea]QCP48659.1 hypothetical protein FAZ95_05315 [Trinickia violacea]
MKTEIRFRIGSTWLCLESGRGPVPEHPDAVTVTLRRSRTNGRPGRCIEANPGTRRNEILALGLRLVELADRMTPETMWSSNQTVQSDGRPPRALNLDAADRALIEHLSLDRPIDFARHVYESSERLHARMPILRAAQSVLGHCDDETAADLYLLLVFADMHGCLPLRSELAATEPG